MVWLTVTRCGLQEKLKHHGLAHLQDQWKKPDWADLDTIRRKKKD
jgi:hypothetical protein